MPEDPHTDVPTEREIHIRETTQSSVTASPRVKPAPTKDAISVPFDYAPSDDGTDENLLILLHGLGKWCQFAAVIFLSRTYVCVDR